MRINRELMGCDVTRGGGMYSTAEFAKRMAALITVFVTDLVAATFLFLQLKGGKWREMVRNLAGLNARGRAFFASWRVIIRA